MSFTYTVKLLDEYGRTISQETIKAQNIDRAMDIGCRLAMTTDHARGFVVRRVRNGEK